MASSLEPRDAIEWRAVLCYNKFLGRSLLMKKEHFVALVREMSADMMEAQGLMFSKRKAEIRVNLENALASSMYKNISKDRQIDRRQSFFSAQNASTQELERMYGISHSDIKKMVQFLIGGEDEKKFFSKIKVFLGKERVLEEGVLNKNRVLNGEKDLMRNNAKADLETN